MYLPEVFSEQDQAEIRRLITEHPLASIVYPTATGLDAEHVPLIFDGADRLIGHLAASNPIVDCLKDGAELMAIFTGQACYISPNWYPTKAEHHRHVPTWNYQRVHVHGRIRFLSDEKSARAVVGKLTKHFEAQTNGAMGWKMSDAPADFMTSMLSKITPFEFVITRFEAKSKVSQNRDTQDFEAIRGEMDARGYHELSDAMRRVSRG